MAADSTIRSVRARSVLDSRGWPTVEVELECGDGSRGRAIVPSGASTGQAEAYELRDGDPAHYDGRGVRLAVENVELVIAEKIEGLDACDQRTLDETLLAIDGTAEKSRLGANAILGVSLAAAHAAAASQGVPLFRHVHWLVQQHAAGEPVAEPRMPPPMTNMISGGLHAGGNLDFQDFLVIPHAAENYTQGLEWIVRMYHRLGELLTAAGYEGHLVGDEGGYGPRLESNRQAAEFVMRAIEAAKLKPGEQVSLALDVASSHFYDDGSYHLAATGDARLTSEQMVDQLQALLDEFPIRLIEDGLAEEDWAGWSRLTGRLGERVTLVGDDLFATNPKRIQRGIAEGAGNAVLIKVNQIGSLTETLQAVRTAVRGGFGTVISARSGETEDDTLADLAVGLAGDYIKIGSVARSERLAKYNQLLRIAEYFEN